MALGETYGLQLELEWRVRSVSAERTMSELCTVMRACKRFNTSAASHRTVTPAPIHRPSLVTTPAPAKPHGQRAISREVSDTNFDFEVRASNTSPSAEC